MEPQDNTTFPQSIRILDQPFRVGDMVQIKGQSQTMSVSAIRPKLVECVWIGTSGIPYKTSYPHEILRKTGRQKKLDDLYVRENYTDVLPQYGYQTET